MDHSPTKTKLSLLCVGDSVTRQHIIGKHGCNNWRSKRHPGGINLSAHGLHAPATATEIQGHNEQQRSGADRHSNRDERKFQTDTSPRNWAATAALVAPPIRGTSSATIATFTMIDSLRRAHKYDRRATPGCLDVYTPALERASAIARLVAIGATTRNIKNHATEAMR